MSVLNFFQNFFHHQPLVSRWLIALGLIILGGVIVYRQTADQSLLITMSIFTVIDSIIFFALYKHAEHLAAMLVTLLFVNAVLFVGASELNHYIVGL